MSATMKDYPVQSQPSVAVLSRDERRLLRAIRDQVGDFDTLADAMNFVFECTQPVCPCDRIAMAFLEEDQHHIVSKWARTTYSPVRLQPGYCEDISQNSLGEVIRAGQPRIISDLVQYAREHPQSRSTALLVSEGVRSSMTCPLTVGDRNVGVMFRSSRLANAYDARQLHIHGAIARQLSQIVEKVHRLDQLKAAQDSYAEMLGFVSHELKSPLASITAVGGLLVDGFLGELQPRQQAEIQKILQKADYLSALVREYLELARLEGDLEAVPQSDVDFAAAVAEPSLEIIRPLVDDKQMHVQMPPSAPKMSVECDPDLLRIVLVNLLSNGVKYGRNRGEIRVSWQRTPNHFELSVWNEGPGFPASEQHRLFRKFSRLDTLELQRQKGTGVGLYSVWRIARLHGGFVSARSEEGAWAQFTIGIPQPVPSTPKHDPTNTIAYAPFPESPLSGEL
ncbi:MAG: GAF domain-containing sensor histidine kinase [Patescibacteria group bacterium]|nr:GAF domain-containing sensor histidine kinase [Patescibacteria group bacterium]